jgi:hypothetical protein
VRLERVKGCLIGLIIRRGLIVRRMAAILDQGKFGFFLRCRNGSSRSSKDFKRRVWALTL